MPYQVTCRVRFVLLQTSILCYKIVSHERFLLIFHVLVMVSLLAAGVAIVVSMEVCELGFVWVFICALLAFISYSDRCRCGNFFQNLHGILHVKARILRSCFRHGPLDWSTTHLYAFCSIPNRVMWLYIQTIDKAIIMPCNFTSGAGLMYLLL